MLWQRKASFVLCQSAVFKVMRSVEFFLTAQLPNYNEEVKLNQHSVLNRVISVEVTLG